MRTGLLLIIATLAATAVASEIPDKFLGSWSVDHSDDTFDAYLEAKGYGWFTRQLVKASKLTKIFTKKSPGVYNYKIESTTKSVEWDNVKPATEFQAEYLDGEQRKITLWYDANNDKLVEKHVEVENPEKIDIYEYKVVGNELVMHMVYGDVKTNRYYKKN